MPQRRMLNILVAIPLALLLILGPSDEAIGEAQASTVPEARRIVVVVNKDNPTKPVTARALKRIFLSQQVTWIDKKQITIFERHSENQIRTVFCESALGMTPDETVKYWNNLKLTRGIKPPKVIRSARLVKHYLERTRGGVAYMYEDELDESVKVIFELRGAPDVTRQATP